MIHFESSDAKKTALADAAKWRLRFKHFPHVAFGVAAGYCAFGYHHAWIDGVDADLARPKLLPERPRDSVHGALCRIVNHCGRRSERTGKRTDVDDAPAVGIEVLECFLSGEKHAKNVHIEHSVKLLLRYFFERDEFINAGVVDQDIDFSEGFLRFSEEPVDFCLLRDIAPNRDRFPSALTNFVDHAIRVLFRRSIVNDHGRTVRRELFRYAGADSLRRPGYHCNFSI